MSNKGANSQDETMNDDLDDLSDDLDDLDDDESSKDENEDEIESAVSSGGGPIPPNPHRATPTPVHARRESSTSLPGNASENNPILDSLLSPQPFQSSLSGKPAANTMLMSMLSDVPAANTIPPSNFPFLAGQNAASGSSAAASTPSATANSAPASSKASTLSTPMTPKAVSTSALGPEASKLSSSSTSGSAAASSALKKQKKRKDHKEKVTAPPPSAGKTKKNSNVQSSTAAGGSRASTPSIESQSSTAVKAADQHHHSESKSTVKAISPSEGPSPQHSKTPERLRSESPASATTPNLQHLNFSWPDLDSGSTRKPTPLNQFSSGAMPGHSQLQNQLQSQYQQLKRPGKRNRSGSLETSRESEGSSEDLSHSGTLTPESESFTLGGKNSNTSAVNANASVLDNASRKGNVSALPGPNKTPVESSNPVSRAGVVATSESPSVTSGATGDSRNPSILKIAKSNDSLKVSKLDTSKTKSAKTSESIGPSPVSVSSSGSTSTSSSSSSAAKKKDGRREKKRRRTESSEPSGSGVSSILSSSHLTSEERDKHVKPLHINLSLDSSLMPPPPPTSSGESRSPACSSPSSEAPFKPINVKAAPSNKKPHHNQLESVNSLPSKSQSKTSSTGSTHGSSKYKTGTAKSGGSSPSSMGSSSPSSGGVKLKPFNLPASTTITPVMSNLIKGNHVSPPVTPPLSSPSSATISIIPSSSPPCDSSSLISAAAMLSNSQQLKGAARASRKGSLSKGSLSAVIDKLRGNTNTPALPSPVGGHHSSHHHATAPSGQQTSGAGGVTVNRMERKESSTASVSSSNVGAGGGAAAKPGEGKSKFSSSDQFTIKQSTGIKLTVTKTRPTSSSEGKSKSKIPHQNLSSSSSSSSSQKQLTPNAIPGALAPSKKSSSHEGKSQSKLSEHSLKSKQISHLHKNNKPTSNTALKSSSTRVSPQTSTGSLPVTSLSTQSVFASLGAPLGTLGTPLVTPLVPDATSSLGLGGGILALPSLASGVSGIGLGAVGLGLDPKGPLNLHNLIQRHPIVTQEMFTAKQPPSVLNPVTPTTMTPSVENPESCKVDRLIPLPNPAHSEKVTDIYPTNLSMSHKMESEQPMAAHSSSLRLGSGFVSSSSDAVVLNLSEPSTTESSVQSESRRLHANPAPSSLALTTGSEASNVVGNKIEIPKLAVTTAGAQPAEEPSSSCGPTTSCREKMMSSVSAMRGKSKDEDEEEDKSPEDDGLVIDYNPEFGNVSTDSKRAPAAGCPTPTSTATAATVAALISAASSHTGSSEAKPLPSSSGEGGSPPQVSAPVKSPFHISPSCTLKSPAPVGTPPSNHSISSSMSRPSPCVIDDDLMDEAVMGLGD